MKWRWRAPSQSSEEEELEDPSTSNSKANWRDLVELEEMNSSFFRNYAHDVNMLSGITEKSREESVTSKSITLKLNDSDSINKLNLLSIEKSTVKRHRMMSPDEEIFNVQTSAIQNEEFKVEYAEDGLYSQPTFSIKWNDVAPKAISENPSTPKILTSRSEEIQKMMNEISGGEKES